MDLYASIIKEEILNENESVATVFSDSDLNNILVKNEPILDEDDNSLVTLKHETLFDAPFATSLSIVKNENQLDAAQLASVDRFVIYELETSQNGGKQTKNIDSWESSTFQFPTNINNNPLINNTNLPLNLNDKITSDQHNLETASCSQLINGISETAVGASNNTAAIPILLNTQLRKRNKIVLPVSSLDKRTRYNIEGTLTKSRNFETQRSSAVSTAGPATQTSSKKIINHSMKHKHVLRKQEMRINEEKLKRDLKTLISAESSEIASKDLVKPSSDRYIPSIETHVNREEYIQCQSPTTAIALHENILTKPELTPSIKSPSTKPAKIGDLRVKCLCRLTVDSSKTTENSEIVDFFKEMYEKTRILTKKQQRHVKMALLQSISEAENDIEQGKCCCF